jgi:glycosyltransferase involved in cell wall biosynthesis
MPAYNTERFIGEAIDSIVAQTDPDWELIVVDDGSTDATAETVTAYEDRRIHLFRQANAGVAAARNAGIAAAKADLIHFLDSDDRLRPDALGRLGEALDDNRGACCAYGDWVFMDEDGALIGPEHRPRYTPRPSGNVLEHILGNNFLVAVGSICARRRCLEQLGGWRERGIGEDWEYWCRLATLGGFSYIGERPVLEYRRRADSAVGTLGRNIDRVFEVIDLVYADPEIRRALPEKTLLRLWRKRMSGACAFGFKHNLAAGNWSDAAGLLVRSVLYDLLNPTKLVLPRLVLQTIERSSRK